MSFFKKLANPINWVTPKGWAEIGDSLLGGDQNKYNSQEAQKERNWQKEMSDTAHQREVADLEAAGLNPILSATGGQGATSGAGASASSQQTPAQSMNAIVGAIATLKDSITSAKSANSQNKLNDNQILNILDEIKNRGITTASNVAKNQAEIEQAEAQAKNQLEQARARKQQTDANEDLGLADNDTGPIRTIAKTKKQAQEKGDSLYEKTKIGVQNLKLKGKLAIQSKKAENEFRQKVKNKLTNNEIVEYNKAILTRNNKKQMQYVRLAKSRGAF